MFSLPSGSTSLSGSLPGGVTQVYNIKVLEISSAAYSGVVVVFLLTYNRTVEKTLQGVFSIPDILLFTFIM